MTEATEAPAAGPASPREVVRALYEAISFGAGEAPDWERARGLFLAEARLTLPNMPRHEGIYSRSVDEWIADFEASRADWPEKGFHESEVAVRSVRFRDLAHVLSAFESRFSPDDPGPFMRGLNSFQLVRHAEQTGGRWRIAAIAWDVETEGAELPADLDRLVEEG
jgi:hypothetical protein